MRLKKKIAGSLAASVKNKSDFLDMSKTGLELQIEQEMEDKDKEIKQLKLDLQETSDKYYDLETRHSEL